MNIVIAGMGKIGATLVSRLASEGHDLVIIDTDSVELGEVANVYDVMGVCGSASDCNTLTEAGVGNAELFVASTGSDELNMLSCFLAKRLGAKNTIARIRNPEYNDNSLGFLRHELDLAMAINPERLAAHALFNILKLPSAMKLETFSRRNFEMIELKLKADSPLDGVTLSAMRLKYKAKFLVCAVLRGERVFIPDGNFELKSGDRIGLTAAPTELERLLHDIGEYRPGAKNVMILGGSRTAYYLAKKLVAAGSSVKLIERDEALCIELCNLLPNATIINGDGAKQELLLEEGLRSADAFVSLTGMDEQNILLSYFAADQGVPKVITKINRSELAPLAQRLNLDSVISPRRAVADVIVSYARALSNSVGSRVDTLYKLMDGKAEALEFTAASDLSFLSKPLRELKLKPNTLIAGIIRDRHPIIPTGNDSVLAGDKVIVFTAEQNFDDLSDIIA